MEEKKLVPKRRFKGFEGDWRLQSVKNMGKKYYGGGTPRTSNSNFWNGDIPWVQSSDLKENEVWIKKIKNSITQEGLQNSATKLVPANSIAIVTRVGVGKLAFIPYEYTTSQDFLSISHLNLSYKFAVYAIYQLLKKEKNSVQGTSIKGMTTDELLSFKLYIPGEQNEQQKIGKFFRVLDERIANQERKIAKVKALKEAYLAEMFPQEGETVPKRRFKGFEGEWEKQLLGNITSIVMGHSPMSSSYTTDKSFPILVQGNADIKKNRIVPRVWTKTVTKMARKKDIIITVRAPVGEVAKTDYDVVLGRGVAGIGGSDYIFYYFYNLKREKYWERISTGSTFDSITSSQLIQLEILLPSLSEQQKIGAFFKNLDDQIEAEEAKLEKLKQMKEAYLEEMFV